MRIRYVLFIALTAVLLSGCAPGRQVNLSLLSPPEVPYEVLPVPEDPVHNVWRPGYWEYDGAGFNWVPATLMSRPYPTAVWNRDRWERRSYGWAFVPGCWQ
ncbi:MAG: BcpO-related WXXGXW repeat protein [Alphaproteobacteria bacterium]|nr:BcpO-related WXXGXW repeat protein [Alphaproteobacteria bacterium]